MTRTVLALLTSLFLALTGAHAEYPSERQILEELNFARTKPQAFVEELREYRSYFEGRIVYLPGDPAGVYTNEGVAAVDEAIAFMKKQRPLPPLAPSVILARAADTHVREQGPEGRIGHASVDGSRAGQRVAQHGGGRFVSETISYGPRTARDVVRQLIIDDGVADRGHRWIIFRPELRFAGVACGYHRRYDGMCVIDYSEWRDGRYVYAYGEQ